jgi:hypothetical protein
MRGSGRAMFASILLVIAGTLNIIYGIAAISNAHFFTSAGSHFALGGSLHAWGWITLIVGVIMLTGGLSLMSGSAYGLFVGIAASAIGAIESLLDVGGAYPFWSLGVFAVCLWVLYGLVIYGTEPQPSTP